MLELELPQGELVKFDGGDMTRMMTVPQGAQTYLFREKSLKQPSFLANALGLYTLLQTRGNKAKWLEIGSTGFSTKKPSGGCSWDPSACGLTFTPGQINLCDAEIQNEICPSELWKSCWGDILGVGNSRKDIYANQDTQQLIEMLIDMIYLNYGNDYYMINTFGLNQLVEDANENKWYRNAGINEKTWKCLYDMLQICGGHMTIIDELKDSGKSNFQCEFPADFFDDDGQCVTGSVIEMLTKVKKKLPKKAKIYANKQARGRMVFGVTPDIFQGLVDEYTATYTNIAEGMYLLMYGEQNDLLGGSSYGALRFCGDWVICMPEWSGLDEYTNTTTHKIIYTLPGNFGLGYDVLPAENSTSGDAGLEILQRLGAPFNGKLFIQGNYKTGAGIMDCDCMSVAQVTINHNV